MRPHEALGMQPPASVYEPSARAYPAKSEGAEASGWAGCRSMSVGIRFYFAELPLARFDT